MKKEDNQTIDAIVSSDSIHGSDDISFRYGRKLDYQDREKLVDLYNNNGNVRVKDISNELNKDRDKSRIKSFSTSTLYRILKEYQSNGKTIEWRKNKRKIIKHKKNSISKKNYLIKKRNNWYERPKKYLSSIVNSGYEKTKTFFKRNIKSILNYALVGVFSFSIGYAVPKNLDSNINKQAMSKNRPENSIEEKIKDETQGYTSGSEVSNYVLLPDELKLNPKFDRRITYSPQNQSQNYPTKDFFLKKGDTLWNIMNNKTSRPDLWEFAYASNESIGKTKNEILKQEKMRELGIKYNLISLKNVGKGQLEPYEIGSQYKISNGTKILFDDNFNEDIKKITPQIESEFNRIFYS